MPRGLAAGAAANLATTIIGALVLSFMLSKESLQWENTGYVIMITLLLSSFSGTAVAISKIKRRRLLVGSLSCGIYFLILILTAVLFFGGTYEAIGITLGVIISGSASALLLTGNKKGSQKHHKGTKIRKL